MTMGSLFFFIKMKNTNLVYGLPVPIIETPLKTSQNVLLT